MVKHGTGNWQTRHEALQARRKAAKLRKQQSADTKSHRKGIQECLATLATTMQASTAEDADNLHVWVNVAPAVDGDEEDVSVVTGTRRKRSVSMSEPAAPPPSSPRGGRLGRGRRSQSFGEAKVHPRSKVVPEESSESSSSTTTIIWACRAHFVTGKCGGGATTASSSRHRKWSPCGLGYQHLEDALCRFVKDPCQRGQVQRALSSFNENLPGAMPAVYLHTLPQLVPQEEQQDLVRTLADWLVQKDLKYSNIIYMGFNDTLIFDTNQEEANLLTGNQDLLQGIESPRVVKGGDDSHNDSSQQDLATVVQSMPTILWEHILTYLPDEAAVCLSQVCLALSHELSASTNLWKQLLARHKWPAFGDTRHREAFISHYSVMRNVRAVQQGLAVALGGNSQRATTTSEFALHPGWALPQQRQSAAAPLFLQPWSPGRVLVGHEDCTLQLLETVTKADGSGGLHCRKLLRHSVDVYRHTKRKQSTLLSLTVDDDWVGCLCRVDPIVGFVASSVGTNSEHLLIVTSREDFLTRDEMNMTQQTNECVECDSALRVINVGQAVLNCLVTLEEDNEDQNRGFWLREFLMLGGDLDHVQVVCSKTMVACGSQHYLMEASVSIPRHGDDDDDDSLQMMDRRLFVISANSQAVVWIGGSCTHLTQNVLHLPSRLSCWRSDDVCSFAVSHGNTVTIGRTKTTTDSVLAMTRPPKALASAMQLHEDLSRQQDWSHDVASRMIAVTARFLVMTNVLYQLGNANDNGESPLLDSKAVVSVHPLSDSESGYTNLSVQDVIRVRNIEFLSDGTYAVLICQTFPRDQQQMVDNTLGSAHSIFFAERICVEAIVIHLGASKQIGRLGLPHGTCGDSPLVVSAFETVIAGYGSGAGIVMTGPAVRNAPLDASMRTMKKREKNKRRRNGKKKDGFQRGSSLFG